jgi:hypothetical protein
LAETVKLLLPPYVSIRTLRIVKVSFYFCDDVFQVTTAIQKIHVLGLRLSLTILSTIRLPTVFLNVTQLGCT